jgi:hypothetical protein
MSRFSQIASIGLATSAVIGIASAPAHAATLFGNDGIKFGADTTVTFEFLQSNGKFKSVFFVADEFGNKIADLLKEKIPFDPGSGPANDFLGTPGVTVSPFVATYTFLANTLYTLGLSGGGAKVFSTNALNTTSIHADQQQALFTGMGPGAYTISFDDTGNNNDFDFNDFSVKATFKAVPEPSLLIGLGAAVLGGLAARRRQDSVA